MQEYQHHYPLANADELKTQALRTRDAFEKHDALIFALNAMTHEKDDWKACAEYYRTEVNRLRALIATLPGGHAHEKLAKD